MRALHRTMKANGSRNAACVALVALMSLWLCGEASAMFTGIDDSADEGTAEAGGETGSRTGEAAAHSTGSGEAIVNPFDDRLGSTMPENRPGEALRRSSVWTARHRNARRFERLLHGDLTPPAAAGPVERTCARSERPKVSNGLDYVVGVLVVAGLGVIGLLLFRRYSSSS